MDFLLCFWPFKKTYDNPSFQWGNLIIFSLSPRPLVTQSSSLSSSPLIHPNPSQDKSHPPCPFSSAASISYITLLHSKQTAIAILTTCALRCTSNAAAGIAAGVLKSAKKSAPKSASSTADSVAVAWRGGEASRNYRVTSRTVAWCKWQRKNDVNVVCTIFR